MNKSGTNQISIVNDMLRTEVEETEEFIKQVNTFKGINFPSHQTTKHPQCPRKQTPHEAKKGNEDLPTILPHSQFLNLQLEKEKKQSYIDGFKNPTSYFKLN